MKPMMQHLISFVLPITVLIVVPALIETHPVIASGLPLTVGVLLVLAGLYLLLQTIASFALIGRGTLARWRPPKHLVVTGMYRHVRNPMILGVILVLIGEALAFRSGAILIWAAIVFAINTMYFMFSEEPGLEKRFGEEYLEYKRNVPRWLPRLKAWRPESRNQ